jgi:hypothetical protein
MIMPDVGVEAGEEEEVVPEGTGTTGTTGTKPNPFKKRKKAIRMGGA